MDDKLKRAWMIAAYNMARCSPDPSTQNGAVLVSGDGKYLFGSAFNMFPPGISLSEDRLSPPDKYDYMEHAEASVIHQAASLGNATLGTTMVCPWAACRTCARALLVSGVKKLITYKPAHDRSHGHWIPSVQRALEMLKEGCVEVEFLDGPLNLGFPIRMDSQEVWF